MIVNVPLLVTAIVLLWFPRAWMRRGAALWQTRRRHRHSPWTTSPLDGSSLSMRREFAKPRSYYDLFRAFAGALALMGSNWIDPALRAPTDAQHSVRQTVLVLQAAVLLVGVLAQTIRYERGRLSLAAPVFYLGGIAMGLGTMAGACGFVLAWLITTASASAQGFLFVLAMVTGVVGFALNGLAPSVLFGPGLCFLPVLLSLLSRKPLVVFSRRRSSSEAGGIP